MSLKQQIKDFIYSDRSPAWLASWYFGRKDARDRDRLNQLLASGEDLLKAVPANQREHWDVRISRVLDSTDNADIPRHAQAGQLTNGQLIMHNGLTW